MNYTVTTGDMSFDWDVDKASLGSSDYFCAHCNAREITKLYGWSSLMRKEYDFSKATKNPYVTKVKKQITIRLDEDAIEYFKLISEEIGIPYQSLINLYLRDCAAKNRKLNIDWK
jgi:uncharacterized protein (DUF4415 family)